MAENFYTLLTDIGKAQLANSSVLGTKVNFKTLKVGDGNGSYYNPIESQTDLIHTVWQGNINSVSTDENNPNWIVIEVMVPSDVGGFTIREYGAFDDKGQMLAICKCAETYKPIITDGSTKELLIKMILSVSNTENITLKIDPTIIFAKKSEVEQLRTDVNAAIAGINSSLSDLMYQLAGGTATALTLTIKGTLVTGYPITFIASANNNGTATTINGKKLYKPATVIAPKLIKDKAYTVWYNASGDNGNGCFFIKASATGTALASQVLKDVPYSNEEDTDLVGTLDLSLLITGNIRAGVTINGVAGKASVVDTVDSTAAVTDILSGKSAYVNGGKLIGSMVNNGAVVINPSATNQVIPAGYHNGSGYVTPVKLIAGDNEFVSANIERYTTSPVYAKLKEIRIVSPSAGIVRVKFNIFSYATGVRAFGMIYVNGVARGIERVNSAGSGIIYAEDISVNPGDLVQLYCHTDPNYSYAAYVNNFTICVSSQIPTGLVNLN